MLFSIKEFNEMQEREAEKIVKYILGRIDEKVKEQTESQIVSKFLEKGEIYIGYQYRVDEANIHFKEYSENDSWNKIWKVAEPKLLAELKELGWKLNDEKMNLIPA